MKAVKAVYYTILYAAVNRGEPLLRRTFALLTLMPSTMCSNCFKNWSLLAWEDMPLKILQSERFTPKYRWYIQLTAHPFVFVLGIDYLQRKP